MSKDQNDDMVTRGLKAGAGGALGVMGVILAISIGLGLLSMLACGGCGALFLSNMKHSLHEQQQLQKAAPAKK